AADTAAVRGVDDAPSRRTLVLLGGEAAAAWGGRLEGPCRRRKVGRAGPARHVGVAGRVHRDAVASVAATAAEVGGVDESGAGGIELRHEGVASTEHTASEGRLERPRCRRKVAGYGLARHVG